MWSNLSSSMPSSPCLPTQDESPLDMSGLHVISTTVMGRMTAPTRQPSHHSVTPAYQGMTPQEEHSVAFPSIWKCSSGQQPPATEGNTEERTKRASHIQNELWKQDPLRDAGQSQPHRLNKTYYFPYEAGNEIAENEKMLYFSDFISLMSNFYEEF